MSDLGFHGREHGREALEEVGGILPTKWHKFQGQWQVLGSRVWEREGGCGREAVPSCMGIARFPLSILGETEMIWPT